MQMVQYTPFLSVSAGGFVFEWDLSKTDSEAQCCFFDNLLNYLCQVPDYMNYDGNIGSKMLSSIIYQENIGVNG